MPHQRRSWSRLDNAAIIFPSTSEKTDTRVFRFCCGLNENIDGEILRKATLKALSDFPSYRCVMKKGFFWYYLEQSFLEPEVKEEYKPPCSAIYSGEADKLLFEITYYKKRINLEIYHVLADGTGALQFLKTIVFYYLLDAHKSELVNAEIEAPCVTPASEKASDSFRKYYVHQKEKHHRKIKHAYRLHGARNEDDILNITEVVVSAKQTVVAAHKYGATLTIYLTALLIDVIHEGMSISDNKYPVVIRVPVNLRHYFPSDTAKNFFGMISVVYDYKSSAEDFNSVIKSVEEQFASLLTKEKLGLRINGLAALEHNPFVKIAPLPVKDLALRAARQIGVKGETVVISNVGKVQMPENLCGYIDCFSVFASTNKLQLCLCSFGDRLCLSFSSAFVNTDIQRNFVRRLTAEGIEAIVNCNMFDKD